MGSDALYLVTTWAIPAIIAITFHMVLVAAAGPAMNIVLAVVAAPAVPSPSQLRGFFHSWSATKSFIKAKGFDPVAPQTERLTASIHARLAGIKCRAMVRLNGGSDVVLREWPFR